MLILFGVTLIVDFIWLIYWGPFWRSDIMKDWERGIHNFVIFMGVVGFIYKVRNLNVDFHNYMDGFS